MTEAMHLFGFSWQAQDAFWEMLGTGHLELLALDASDGLRMRELMHEYRDLPMDIADASLVRLAEREEQRRVFTTDRRNFSVYRVGAPDGSRSFPDWLRRGCRAARERVPARSTAGSIGRATPVNDSG